MNPRDFFHRVFVDDALLKVISLVLALVLFFIVRNDHDAATTVYASVVYVLPTERVLVSDPVTEVRLGVRGPWTRVSRLPGRATESLRVDLTRVSDGELTFTEEMIKLPAGLRLVSITPPSVQLHFEPRVERRVPVEPLLEGEVAPGYRVVRRQPRPSEVSVSGARSAVARVQRARTRPLRITEARENIRGEVMLEPAPQHAAWGYTDPIVVDVTVAPALVERSLGKLPIKLNGATRLEAHLEPATAEAVLRGPAQAVAAAADDPPTLMVDASGEDTHPPGVFRKRVQVVGLPAGVTAETRPEVVTLTTLRRKRN